MKALISSLAIATFLITFASVASHVPKHDLSQVAFAATGSSVGGGASGLGGEGEAVGDDPVPVCGDGTIDAGEQCDGANLGGASCTTRGFTGGTLSCSASCTFVTSSCTNGGGGGGGGASGVGGEAEADGGSSGDIPLCGFAWAGTSETPTGYMGAGWVSFNSEDCDTDGNGTISSGEASNTPGCPAGATADYAVSVANNGDMTGYAWSSTLGWLKFGGLTGSGSDMPSTSGNTSSNAKLSGSNVLSGWARFCEGADDESTGNGDGICSPSTSRTDGWDGWLSLKGSGTLSGSYGVLFDGTSRFSGYSWGGDVVGWLNWSPSGTTGVRYCTVETLNVSLDATPSTGTATIPSVTLTATPSTGGTTGTYKFKCDVSDSSYITQTDDNTYVCTNYYQLAGRNYTPIVELTRGDLQATSTATVTTDALPDDLNLSCTFHADPVLINQPETWTATINNPSAPPYNSYSYVFNFMRDDGSGNMVADPATPTQPNPVTVNGSANVSESVDRTYGTLGNKSVIVTVTDSGVPIRATGQCTADISVIIRPNVIEI